MLANPRFSIVSAVFNVARYLPEFIASLEAQTFGFDGIEVILVDDGSTDETPRLLAEIQARHPQNVTVITQANAGQGAARTAGLAAATGEWITFPDPDDTLDAKYFERVDTFLRAHDDVEMIGTYRILHFDESDTFSDTHPLRNQFAGKDRVVDLDRNEKLFYGSAPCAFFRRDRIVEAGITFDSRIRPNFEDGHFVVMYLLASPTRRIGLLASAVYNYRKRADGSSTLQNSLMDERRYTVVPELGYLDALEKASQAYGGQAPAWLQTHILYELSWYFSAEEKASGSATAATGEVGARFIELLARISAHLEERVVLTFNTRHLSVIARQIILHVGDPDWHTPYVVSQSVDEDQRLTAVSYRYTGEVGPTARFTRRSAEIAPVHSKVVGHTRFGHVLLRQRDVWLPGVTSAVTELDGQLMQVHDRWPSGPFYRAPRVDLAPTEATDDSRRARPSRAARQALRINRFARTRLVRRFFADAWVLMDRTQDADDSGELLFRHLRSKKRSINAWFVIEKGTPDHKRLRAEGYKRIIPYGSLRWKLLLANAEHLISSHADKPVVNPAKLAGITRNWRFTFLQHGVIKDDISGWLNPKPVDLFVTSTTAEHAYISGDDSPFRFSTREVKLTELPRFDRLHAAGTRVTADEQDLLLITPTWRSWLVPQLSGDSQRREALDDSVLESDYVRAWGNLLRSEEVATLAREHNLTIAFMPHPNMQPLIEKMNLPAHVTTLGYVGTDIASTFARAAVLVTDYSSVAFNAAFMERPVLYYQFDADDVLHGAHVGRAGYFDYERDGFGPVSFEHDDAVARLADLLGAGRRSAGIYAERVRQTFPLRDGRACARVVTAIQALDKRQDR